MVNSKKMSKSKVAMIALAILLVLSLILTATGAWFTDKAVGGDQGENNSFQFGQVTESLAVSSTAMSVSLAGAKAVPGDGVTLPEITVSYSANFKTYLFITMSNIVVKQNGTALTNAQIAVLFEEATAQDGLVLGLDDGFTALAGQTGVYYKVYDAGADVDVTSNTYSLTIDTDLTRATKLQSGDSAPVLENSTITIEYSVSAAVVQFDHATDAATAYSYIPA